MTQNKTGERVLRMRIGDTREMMYECAVGKQRPERMLVRTGVHADRAITTWLALETCLAVAPSPTANTRQTERKERTATYDSVSESSVSRLLATLFASPKESSLWYLRSMLGRRMAGRGGTASLASISDRSSWLVEGLRFFLLLNSLDMRRWCVDEVSLRASSELLRLRNLSLVPSVDLRRSSLDLSLLATETVEEAGPLDVARLTGAARELSLPVWPNKELMLRRRPVEAMLITASVAWEGASMLRMALQGHVDVARVGWDLGRGGWISIT